MSDLDEAGRALLALADDAHDPTDLDRARVRAALGRRLGAAAGLGFGTVAGVAATAKAAAGAGGVASAGGAGAAVAGGTLTAKLVGVALVVTTTVGFGAGVKFARRSADAPAAAKSSDVSAHRKVAAAPGAVAPVVAPPTLPAPVHEQSTIEELPPAPRHEARLHSAPPRHALPPIEAPPMEAPPAPTTPPPAIETPATIEARDGTGAVARRPPAAPAAASDPACAPAPASQSGVAGEARLVTDGVRALRSGRSACALSLFDTHARVFPEGVLAEERDAERALALAALGQTAAARIAAAAFLRRYPASPLGARLRHLADAAR
jgi:hypothetical protein